MPNKIVASSTITLCLVLAAASAQSQTWPSKPIRFIVQGPPGAATDLLTRTIAPMLGDGLGQQVIVDNRPGAGGMIAVELAAKSPPVGYTLVLAAVGPIAINPSLYAKMPYDPVKELAPLTLAGNIFNVLIVHPALPAQSVKALIALARARPGELNYGSAGAGAADHLSAELFQVMTKTKMVHIPYKGGPLAMVDLISGNLHLMFVTVPVAIGLIKGGKVRPMAIANSKRFPLMPELPTVAEAGIPGFAVDNWCGVFATGGTPARIVARLNAELVKALAVPDMKKRLLENGIDAVSNTPEQFAAYIRAETTKWAAVVKDANVKLD
ncbi:MAG: tripartite tricarboxylate transporter substrate binding protein [Sulfuricaulis sp.]|nr:tripartite tricarboxylate transporter substrate binding protein [Sulfuricaulis sp.]